MIIDSKAYSGLCTCGRNHEMETWLAVVEAGCLNKAEDYLKQVELTGFRVTVYDENTYRAKGMVHIPADKEIILNPEGLHADEHGVDALLAQLPEEPGVLIAVGSGSVHDIVRYCAYLKKVPFVSCPTAASVDGYCSSVAAMTWEGAKKTLTAAAPRLVLADLNVISQAPLYLARSGFGDMIGKYVALTDWRMAHVLTGEFYCERIAGIMSEATQAIQDSAAAIAAGDTTAYEKLTYGLLLSGIAMQMMGNSRPASGGEHHISHFIEMEPDGVGVKNLALHGEKVGVGTLLVAEEYHRLMTLPEECWGDYPGVGTEEINAVFGDRLNRQIEKENEADCASGITGERIRGCLDAIRAEVAKLPTAEELRKAYEAVGAKSCLSDIGVSEELLPTLYHSSPIARNRLTLMRLRRCIGER